MKVAMVTTYATPRNMRRELLETIAARGHEIVVVAPEPPDVMAGAVAELGATYHQWSVNRTAIAPHRDARSAARLYAILTREKPDVVLAFQIKAVLLAPLVAKLARVTRVVTLVNGLGAVFDDHGFGLTWKAKLARMAYGLSLRAVDEIVFQNPDDPQLLISIGVLPRDANMRVVPGTGVDVEQLVAQPPHVDPPTFTLISRLLVSKGVRELVAAARHIRRRYPNTRFRLVGQLESENHPDSIRRDEIAQWISEGIVEYVGFTDDIVRVLRETTVFVLPSYYREGIPRTNLEALAVGRPIVTTDWVGCRETVIDGVNGFLVPPKDSSVLAERLERYLRTPELVALHARASRELAEQRFDIRKVNALMCDALRV
jgi:glycosyltransferase involved in cell wall biosynthesis